MFGPVCQRHLSGSLRSNKRPHIHSELSVKLDILALLWISLSSKTLLFSADKIILKWIIFGCFFFGLQSSFKCTKHDINQCCTKSLCFNLLTPIRAKWFSSLSQIPRKNNNEWITRGLTAPSFEPHWADCCTGWRVSSSKKSTRALNLYLSTTENHLKHIPSCVSDVFVTHF